MAIRQVDIYAIGAALGYTPGQTRSIHSIQIFGQDHKAIVTRFVQNPGTREPAKTISLGDTFKETNEIIDFVETYGAPALVADDIFRYQAIQPEVVPEYDNLKMSKAAVQALKKLQWGTDDSSGRN